MKRRKPTILDIARDLGVSKSLVSLALSGGDGVSEASRKRILEAADRLGYSRNTWARSLVSGRTGLIGVAVSDAASDYNTDVVVGVEDSAVTAGYTTLLAHGRRDSTVLGQRIQTMRELGVEGLIIVSSRAPLPVVENVATQLPVVIVGRPASIPQGVDVIHNNDEVGGQLAVEHLLQTGHQRIGFIGAHSGAAIAARHTAYEQAMAAANTDYRWSRHYDKTNVDAFLQDIVKELQSDRDAPTAVFVASDATAVALMGFALDAGLRIPEDLAIVGYNDLRLAETTRPRMSSVHQPREAMGELAMTLLGERMAGRSNDIVRIIEPTLSIRDSSATS